MPQRSRVRAGAPGLPGYPGGDSQSTPPPNLGKYGGKRHNLPSSHQPSLLSALHLIGQQMGVLLNDLDSIREEAASESGQAIH